MHDCTTIGRLQAQAADRFRNVITAITTERSRQDAKWGEQNHDFPTWLAILQEELGEAARAYLKGTFSQTEAAGAIREGKPVDMTPALDHLREFRKELVQTAAVLVAAIESGDRNDWWPAS